MSGQNKKIGIFYVYMIMGTDLKLYTGITTNIERRIEEHNGLRKGGARYTRRARPYSLEYVEGAASRSDALRREHAIKQLTRLEKIALIQEGKKNRVTE